MDDGTQKTLFGVIFAALTGLYGLFIKHVFGHVDEKQAISNKKDIDNLYDIKQSKDSCREIVKRLEENHVETCRKLDRILNKLESV